MMDCRHARMLLEVAHPLATELEATETEALAVHLADCPECGPLAEADRRVDEKIGAAMRDVAVPQGLRERIGRRLQVERDVWLRGLVIRTLGAAAAVIAVGWIGLLWIGKPVEPDLHQVLGVVDQRESSAKMVEQVFADMGVTMVAPRKFDYRNLVSFNMAVFPDGNGKLAPHLVFVRREQNGAQFSAQVYVLSGRTFKLDEIRTATLVGSQQNIKVDGIESNPHVVYVIIYTGPSCDAFFAKNKPEA
jgi:hypothetical protein